MPELELEESSRHPSRALRSVAPVTETRLETDARQWMDAIRSELDAYYGLVKEWATSEPDIVLQEISAISARLTEVRAQLNRDNGQRANRLRISEIDPLIEQLEFQFKVHSRIQAVREMDFRMSGGGI